MCLSLTGPRRTGGCRHPSLDRFSQGPPKLVATASANVLHDRFAVGPADCALDCSPVSFSISSEELGHGVGLRRGIFPV